MGERRAAGAKRNRVKPRGPARPALRADRVGDRRGEERAPQGDPRLGRRLGLHRPDGVGQGSGGLGAERRDGLRREGLRARDPGAVVREVPLDEGHEAEPDGDRERE